MSGIQIPSTKNVMLIFLDTDNQRVIVKVKDVNDEPPYFINRPLPMQAVVKLNAPPNTRVFTLQAKDPDTDHNLHYFLVRDRSELSFFNKWTVYNFIYRALKHWNPFPNLTRYLQKQKGSE